MRFLVLLAAFCLVAAEKRRYDNYHTFRVTAASMSQLEEIRHLEYKDGFDLLIVGGVDKPSTILVHPERVPELKGFLKIHRIPFEVTSTNVQPKLEEEEKWIAPLGSKMNWTHYHLYDDIEAFLTEVSENIPEYTTIISIGSSYEGRNMDVLKVSSEESPKASIWIDAGIHAREWIAPATATFILNELQTLIMDGDTSLIDNVDWYFLPVVNPDGYEYTFSNDRYWRKTRVPYDLCYGADPNRNFPFQWGGEGTSGSPCSDIYHGPWELSEPCALNTHDYVDSIKDNVHAYITLHSYGQWWLIPYGYTSPPDYPPDYDEMLSVSNDCVDALEAVHNTNYVVGNSAELLYPAAGASDDWAKSVGIKYSQTVELRDRNDFILPPEQIIPTGEETWAAVQVMHSQVESEFGKK